MDVDDEAFVRAARNGVGAGRGLSLESDAPAFDLYQLYPRP